LACGLPDGQFPVDADWMAEQVQHRAVGVDGFGQLPVALRGLWPADSDLKANRPETRADRVINPEETPHIQVTLDVDVHPVESYAQMRGPEAIGDGLARPEGSQGVLDRIGRGVAATETLRLVDGELVARTDQGGYFLVPTRSWLVRKTACACLGSAATAALVAWMTSVSDMRLTLQSSIVLASCSDETDLTV
jgi:hypothetical protein